MAGAASTACDAALALAPLTCALPVPVYPVPHGCIAGWIDVAALRVEPKVRVLRDRWLHDPQALRGRRPCAGLEAVGRSPGAAGNVDAVVDLAAIAARVRIFPSARQADVGHVGTAANVVGGRADARRGAVALALVGGRGRRGRTHGDQAGDGN